MDNPGKISTLAKTNKTTKTQHRKLKKMSNKHPIKNLG